MFRRQRSADDGVDPALLTGELLIAARDELALQPTDATHEAGGEAAMRRLLAQGTHRLTPVAAQLVALQPRGGGPGALVAMMAAGRLVIIQRRVERPIAGSAPRRRVLAVPSAALPEARRATSWIKFRVVHHVTGEPFAGVRLVVRTPSGLEVHCRTDSAGLAGLDDIGRGVCDVWCPLKDARLAQTVAFIGLGEPGPAAATAEDRGRWGATAEWVAHVDEHHVQTGETLKSIAEAHSYSWQELAEFNWGTSSPDEVNRHLRDDVGCTVRTRDGFNYRFTSEDEPGLIYIPQPWSQSGLATERTHVIRVRLAAGFRLILENDDGLRIPEAEYEVTLADGSVQTGRLGRSGLSLIKDPPPGPVDVRYLDLDDIEAKSLAATVRKAFDDRQPLEIHRVFRYPTETVQRAFGAYDRYYNDYHGQGLRTDLEQEFFGDEEAELIFFGYLSGAEMPWTKPSDGAAAPAEEPAHA